MSQINIHS